MAHVGRTKEEPLSSYVQWRLVGLGEKALGPAAKAVGLPPSGANQVKSGKLGVSSGTVERYAKMLGFPSAVELRTEAELWDYCQSIIQATVRRPMPTMTDEDPKPKKRGR